jgi:hypothetical protein
MPQSPRSLRLTDAYRQRVIATRERLQTQAQRTWPTIDTLDGTDWVDRMAAALTQAQTEAVRVSSAYLSAFIASETGKRGRVSIDSRNYAGKSRDGRPLAESLRSPLVGTLKGLKDGLGASESLALGLHRAVRMVGVDYDNAHHTALMDTIASDDRFDGWSRSLSGTCGACASVASGVSHGLHFPVHPGCQCVASPIVKGAANTFPVPTGVEIFNEKSKQEQDEMLGPDSAALVRAGIITLDDLKGESELDTEPNFITQKPLSAVT